MSKSAASQIFFSHINSIAQIQWTGHEFGKWRITVFGENSTFSSTFCFSLFTHLNMPIFMDGRSKCGLN